MRRSLLRKFTPDPQKLQGRWFLRPFRTRLGDPRLWTLSRRGVTYAFGVGLAICFIPLPVHLALACAIAVACGLNLPVAAGTTFLLNPFTAVPVYYFCYRVGAALLHVPRQHFHFVPSWRWFARELTPVWPSFVLGCLACAIVAGFTGWLALELVWRWQVTSRYRTRHQVRADATPEDSRRASVPRSSS
jgi:uncharacterized protein (DUF2062 family)